MGCEPNRETTDVASHQKRVEMMAAIERQRRARLDREAYKRQQKADERILRVQKLIGENPNKRCQHCKRQAVVVGHATDCKLRGIRPEVIEKGKKDAAIHIRKNVNRQRIFKSDKKSWNGLPAPIGKTLVRKRATKNRGPVRELRHCRVCNETTIFISTAGGQVCHKCAHSKPCEFSEDDRLCQTCFP